MGKYKRKSENSVCECVCVEYAAVSNDTSLSASLSSSLGYKMVHDGPRVMCERARVCVFRVIFRKFPTNQFDRRPFMW